MLECKYWRPLAFERVKSVGAAKVARTRQMSATQVHTNTDTLGLFSFLIYIKEEFCLHVAIITDFFPMDLDRIILEHVTHESKTAFMNAQVYF